MTKRIVKDVRKDVISKMIEQAGREIMQNQILSEFYAVLATEQDPETAAKTSLKKLQVDNTLAFNQRFNEYLKSL